LREGGRGEARDGDRGGEKVADLGHGASPERGLALGSALVSV